MFDFIAAFGTVGVIAAVAYAVKHHITVAQAKADAEAVIAKVKTEVSVLSADAATVVAKVKALVNAK